MADRQKVQILTRLTSSPFHLLFTKCSCETLGALAGKSCLCERLLTLPSIVTCDGEAGLAGFNVYHGDGARCKEDPIIVNDELADTTCAG